MKSLPNLNSDRNFEFSNTLTSRKELSKNEENTTEKETQKADFSQIKVPKILELSRKEENTEQPTEYYHNNFTYEKERMKAIVHTELFQTLQSSTANPDTGIFSTNLSSITKPINLDAEQNKCKVIYQIQKIISIIFMLYAIADFVMTFFAIIFLSISNLPIVSYLLWIFSEFILTSGFIFISIKGHNAANFELSDINSHICRVALVFIGLLSALVGTQISKNITEMLACGLSYKNQAKNIEQTSDSMLCILITAFFFSCLVKLVFTGIYLGIAIFIRILAIKKQEELETKIIREVKINDESMSAKKLKDAI